MIPSVCELNLSMFGNTDASCAGGTPSQAASVPPYWSVEVKHGLARVRVLERAYETTLTAETPEAAEFSHGKFSAISASSAVKRDFFTGSYDGASSQPQRLPSGALSL